MSFLGVCLFVCFSHMGYVTYRSSHHTKLVTLFPQVPIDAVKDGNNHSEINYCTLPVCQTNEYTNSSGLQSLQKDLSFQFQLSFSTSKIFLIIMNSTGLDELTFFCFLLNLGYKQTFMASCLWLTRRQYNNNKCCNILQETLWKV